MLKIKKKKFRTLFYVSSISIILILALVSNFLILHNMQVEQNVKLKQLTDFIISEKKSYLKNLIYGTIKDIELEKDLLIKEKEQGIATFYSNKELQDILKERAKYKIKNSILPDGSYIWINKVINYDGGKNYGVRLVHPNLPQTEGMLLSTDMTDIAGKFPYKEELEGVKENGEIFFEYYFKKLNTNFISRKLTFAKLYKEFDWIIASGVHLDDVNRLIEDQNAKIKAVYIRQLKFVNAIFLLGTFFAVLIAYSFEKKIDKLIDFYNIKISKMEANLVSEKKTVENNFKELEEIAYTDQLTKILNRRPMINFLKKISTTPSAENTESAIILCDIDHFKKINDTYGHNYGDSVICRVANILSKNLNPEDKISRWGGEEFLIFISNCNRGQATKICETLRKKIQNEIFKFEDNYFNITVTFGCTSFHDKINCKHALESVDRALYTGKNSGRNKVIFIDAN